MRGIVMKRETQTVEFKQSWHDEYLKWICGFANAQGGKLIIGVDDSSRAVGVANAKKLMEDIPNKIVSLLGIVANVNLVVRDGCDTIEIDVSPSSVPISYHGIYHYRSGTTHQELTGIALQQFILKKLGRTWDDFVCDGATMDEIDSAAIKYFLRKAGDAQRLEVAKGRHRISDVLTSLGLVDGDGNLKNAAVLLFAKNPQKFFPGVEFRIGRFHQDESDLIIQDSIGGNIIQMTDKVIEVLRAKYLVSPIHYEGLQRIEPLEIPEVALREAIFNSIIHKDYTGPHIQMKVYDDRITIWNDGMLPDGITVESLMKEHASRPRNKNIAAVFYRAGFIESWGRGIKKICKAFTEAGLPPPKFDEISNGTRITIERTAAKSIVQGRNVGALNGALNDPLNDPLKVEILRLVGECPGVNRTRLALRTGRNVEAVKRAIAVLVAMKRIERRGSKKTGGYYIVTEAES